MQQEDLLNTWFAANKTGFDYSNFASATHWADTDPRAWVGTYYCYNPDPPNLPFRWSCRKLSMAS